MYRSDVSRRVLQPRRKSSQGEKQNVTKLYSLSLFGRAGGGSGGGLDRGVGVRGGSQGVDEANVLGLGRDLHFTLVPPLTT